jgi:hypothetical protein
MAVPTSRGRRLLHAAAISTVAIAGATVAFGPLGFAAASSAGLLATAWYGDDALGTCLPIAAMFLLAVAVLVVLLGFTVLAFRT